MSGKKVLEPAWLRPKLRMSPNFQTRAISWWVTRVADSPRWGPGSPSCFLQGHLICPLPSWQRCVARLSSWFAMLAPTKNKLLLKRVQRKLQHLWFSFPVWFPTTLSSGEGLDWLPWKVQRPRWFLSPSTGVTDTYHEAWLLHGCLQRIKIRPLFFISEPSP